MDLQSILSLIGGLNNNNQNLSSGLMSFLSQSQNSQNSAGQNASTQNNNSGLDINQILPFLSSLNGGQNGLNINSLLPFLQNMKFPNGLNAINNLNGMENFPNIFSQGQNQNPKQNNTIRSKNFNKNFNDYKRL